MFAYIKNNEIIHTSPISIMNDEHRNNGVIEVQYDDNFIQNPACKFNYIYEQSGGPYGLRSQVVNKLISMKDISTVTVIDLAGEVFTEADFEYIKKKRCFPNGIEDLFIKMFTGMASGDMTIATELGQPIVAEMRKMDQVKKIILANNRS